MTKQELFELHQEVSAKCLDTLKKKSADYTAISKDPFANFKGSEFLGVEPEIGVLIRIMDKFKRIESYIRKGELKVEDEGVLDSLEDSINYIILIYGMIKDRQNGQSG